MGTAHTRPRGVRSARSEVKTRHVPAGRDGAFEVGHLEVDVADVHAGIQCHRHPNARTSVRQCARTSPTLRPLQQRALRRLPGQLLQRLREVRAIVQQEHAARALGQEEGHERRVRLGRVAVAAGEHQVVRAVVGRLAAPRAHMVEGDGIGGDFGAAVGADGAVLGEEPLSVRLLAATFGTTKCGGSSGAGWIAPAT